MSFLIYRREAITSSGGKGGDNRGNRRRPFRRRGYNGQDSENQNRNESGNRGDSNIRADFSKRGDSTHRRDRHDPNRNEKPRAPVYERPKWTPPKIPAEPLPSPDCPYCGKPIRDIASALGEKGTGNAVHFDCIINKIAQDETLEKGEFVSYIGGGRFGIVQFNNPPEPKKFIIKKIFEWENKDERPEWRVNISDYYPVT